MLGLDRRNRTPGSAPGGDEVNWKAWLLAIILFAPTPWATIATLNAGASTEPYTNLPRPVVKTVWTDGFAGHFPLALQLVLLLDPRVSSLELDRTASHMR